MKQTVLVTNFSAAITKIVNVALIWGHDHVFKVNKIPEQLGTNIQYRNQKT